MRLSAQSGDSDSTKSPVDPPTRSAYLHKQSLVCYSALAREAFWAEDNCFLAGGCLVPEQ